MTARPAAPPPPPEDLEELAEPCRYGPTLLICETHQAFWSNALPRCEVATEILATLEGSTP